MTVLALVSEVTSAGSLLPFRKLKVVGTSEVGTTAAVIFGTILPTVLGNASEVGLLGTLSFTKVYSPPSLVSYEEAVGVVPYRRSALASASYTEYSGTLAGRKSFTLLTVSEVDSAGTPRKVKKYSVGVLRSTETATISYKAPYKRFYGEFHVVLESPHVINIQHLS